jgi:hypothetical protein
VTVHPASDGCDILDYNDCVVDNWTDRRGYAAQRHQIEAQTGEPHRQKRRQLSLVSRDGNKGRSRVSEKSIENRDSRRRPIRIESRTEVIEARISSD